MNINLGIKSIDNGFVVTYTQYPEIPDNFDYHNPYPAAISKEIFAKDAEAVAAVLTSIAQAII